VLKASNPDEATKVIELSREFLLLLAGQLPADQSAVRQALTAASVELLEQAAAVEVDPAVPLLAQLPLANDAEFRSAIETGLAVNASVNGCG
jgi:hypothetical protein